MGTIGLAHRTHREFVPEWGDADGAAVPPDEHPDPEAERGGRQGGRVTAILERPRDPSLTPGDEGRRRDDDHWLVGEPMF